MRRYTLLCEDSVADEVESLADENGLSEGEVLRQLVARGLESLD